MKTTKTNCPFCNAKKEPESGIWDFFACGTDQDKFGKSRQSFSCVTIQRDNLLAKVAELQDQLNLKRY